MQHPYKELEPIIATQINKVQILPERRPRVEAIAKHLLGFKDQYAAVSAATGVPVIVVATIHERESDADFSTYLGNGDPLNHPSVNVPRGRGPFKSWSAGAIDALVYDRLNQVNDWSWERAVYEWTLYNGFGPLAHGHQSGYVWSGTNIYDGGKYIRDGLWSPTTWDTQLGCFPVASIMVELDSTLAIARATDVAPVAEDAPPTLDGVGGSTPDNPTFQLQAELNKLQVTSQPLTLDGSYGRRTRHAVEIFQDHAHLTVDGIAGPETLAALSEAISKLA